jgi:hypothetical protein
MKRAGAAVGAEYGHKDLYHPDGEMLERIYLDMLAASEHPLARMVREDEEMGLYDDEAVPLSPNVPNPEASEIMREALKRCRELFYEIRMDWSDPRSECREGVALIDEALSSICKGEREGG